MGLFDILKNLTNPYDSEESGFIDEAGGSKAEPAVQKRSGSFSGARRSGAHPPSTAAVSQAPAPVRYSSAARGPRREGRVVSIAGGAGTQAQQMVFVKPERYENARDIADHLRSRRPVVLNLETTPNEVSRRLLDFLSGVAYAQDSRIEPIATRTYLITPNDISLSGDFIAGEFAGGLESGSAYL